MNLITLLALGAKLGAKGVGGGRGGPTGLSVIESASMPRDFRPGHGASVNGRCAARSLMTPRLVDQFDGCDKSVGVFEQVPKSWFATLLRFVPVSAAVGDTLTRRSGPAYLVGNGDASTWNSHRDAPVRGIHRSKISHRPNTITKPETTFPDHSLHQSPDHRPFHHRRIVAFGGGLG